MKLGMWVWPNSVQVRGAEKVVSACIRAGTTDLYFLTKGLLGLASHQSKAAPCVCERDLLQELLDEAHKNGIRVHVWFTSASDQNYKEQHPESGRYHYTRGRDRGLISLTDKGYLDYMAEIVREVCRSYEVDGLHLDYIRYNHLLYGWSEEDMERYSAQGADLQKLRNMIRRMFLDEHKEPELLMDAFRAGDPNALALANARRRDVVAFAKTLIDAACAERSGLLLSAALMPEGAYEDKAFADLHYGQNYEDLAGLVAYGLPMAYSHAYGKGADWVKEVAEGTLKTGLKTLVGLHAFEGGTGPALQRDIQAVERLPIEGICLFREGASALAFANGTKLSVLNTMNEAITRIAVAGSEKTIQLDCELSTDEEKMFSLPFVPETVCAFAGTEERCVYLKKQQ